jgi:uncharacterized iron-regulated membrane protein
MGSAQNRGMNFLFDFVAGALRGLIRLTMVALGAVFLLGLLLSALLAVVGTIVWSLLTGRKPAVFTMVSRFQQASRQFRTGAWPGANRSAPGSADVVDVEAHEVRQALGSAGPPKDPG